VTRHRGTATIEGTPAGGTRVVVELPEGRWVAEAQGREGAGGAAGAGDGVSGEVTCVS
jgi:hypothetical protein